MPARLSSMTPSLTALLTPLPLTEFRKFYLRNEAFMVDTSSDLVQDLMNLPFLDDLESLLRIWPKPVSVHLPDLRDEASSLETDAQSAMKSFEEGMGLLFHDAQFLSPLLDEWLR